MKVLVTRKIPPNGIEILKQHKEIEIDYRQGPPLTPEEMRAALKVADAAIVVIPDRITKEVLEEAENLKLVACYSVGYDHVDTAFCSSKKIYVSNTPGDLTEAVAEHAFALMMASARRVIEADFYVRDGQYKYWDPMIFLGPKVMGKTLGIVGFGRIGQHLARMAQNGLGMKILYTDPKEIGKDLSGVDAKKVELNELLTESDFVSLHCNLTEETRHLIGPKQFKLMKPFGILINTARGGIVNEEALASALEEEEIAGAALDVFEEEPKVHPKLISMPKVVLTPHIASATREARIQMAHMACDNIIEVLINKKPPINWVNKW